MPALDPSTNVTVGKTNTQDQEIRTNATKKIKLGKGFKNVQG